MAWGAKSREDACSVDSARNLVSEGRRSRALRNGWALLAAIAINLAFMLMTLLGTGLTRQLVARRDVQVVYIPQQRVPAVKRHFIKRPSGTRRATPPKWASLRTLPVLNRDALTSLPTLWNADGQQTSSPAFQEVGANGGHRAGTSPENAEDARLMSFRNRGIDVVFVIDVTGSMEWVLTDVTMQVREIANVLRSLAPLTRIGVVVYHGAEAPHVPVSMQPLTYSTVKLKQFLSALHASGGGGLEKDVGGGLEAAVRKAGWRKTSREIIVLVGDGPPPNGALRAIYKVVRAFARQGGRLAVVDASGQANPALVEREIGRPVDYAMYRSAPMYAFREIAEAAGRNATTLRGNLNLAQVLVGLVLGVNPTPLFSVVKMRRNSSIFKTKGTQGTTPDASVALEAKLPNSTVFRQLTNQMAMRAHEATTGLMPPSEIQKSIADVRWILKELHRRQLELEKPREIDEHALKTLYESPAWRDIAYADDWLPCWLGWLELADRHTASTNNVMRLQSLQSVFRAGQIRSWRPELAVQSSRGLARVALAEHKPSEALSILRAAREQYGARVSRRTRMSLNTDIQSLEAPIVAVSTKHKNKPQVSDAELAAIDALIRQQLRFGTGAAEAAPRIRGLLHSGSWDVRLADLVLSAKAAFADQDIGVLGDLAVAEEALNNKHYYSAVESYRSFFQAVRDASDRGLARYRYRYGLACMEAGLYDCALQVTEGIGRSGKAKHDVTSAVLKLRFLASYEHAREVPSSNARAQLRVCAAAFLADAPTDPDAQMAKRALAQTSPERVAPARIGAGDVRTRSLRHLSQLVPSRRHQTGQQ